MYTKEKYCLRFQEKKHISRKSSSVENCCATLDSVDTWKQWLRFDFIETFIRPFRAFWWLRLYNVPNLKWYHDDHVTSNNAALSNLVYRLLPSFLSHSQRTPAFGWQDTRLSEPQWQQWLPIRWEWMWRQGKKNYCKCTHCMLCLIIMCNVAALTFYATIYEDICCICNKSREKHVLGTASTAGSLCLFDL